MNAHPNNPPPIIQDRYRLAEWLGQGTMGVVYRAHDDFLDRDVAIKLLPPAQVGGGERSARFLREARTVARLSHPNIMTLFDAGEAEGWLYLVVEMISGKDLYSYLQENGGRLEIAEGLRIIREILEGLHYAHEQDVLHRDIKPENVMITSRGQVKITDFGLALTQHDPRLTTDGAVVGTAHYMAPEVLQGTPADRRTDLYAVGALLYEMVTSRPPFVGDDLVAIFGQILHGEFEPPSQIVPGLPKEVETVILTLLHRDPDQRFPTAQAVLETLASLTGLSDPGTVTKPSDSTTLAWETSSLLARVLTGSSSRLGSAASAAQKASEVEAGGEYEEDASVETELNQALMLYAALEDTAAAVETERRRLADMLKTAVLEPLNLLLSQSSTYEQTLGAANPNIKMVASVLTALARQAIQQVRDLENHLHPAVLDTLGLEPALEALAGQVMRTNGTLVVLNLERLRERLPAQVELALFRISQDALERSHRHGHASEVEISLSLREELVEFVITDNGVATAGQDLLRTALQRIQQLGGQVSLHQNNTGGLAVTTTFRLDPLVQLTPREMEVIQLAAEGLSNKQIGLALFISPRTVNFHLDNIYTKLGVNTRTEAAIYAIRHGWIRPLNLNNE